MNQSINHLLNSKHGHITLSIIGSSIYSVTVGRREDVNKWNVQIDLFWLINQTINQDWPMESPTRYNDLQYNQQHIYAVLYMPREVRRKTPEERMRLGFYCKTPIIFQNYANHLCKLGEGNPLTGDGCRLIDRRCNDPGDECRLPFAGVSDRRRAAESSTSDDNIRSIFGWNLQSFKT